jgi:hypothetical protein
MVVYHDLPWIRAVFFWGTVFNHPMCSFSNTFQVNRNRGPPIDVDSRHSPGTRRDHQGRTPLDPSDWCLEGISESLLHVLGWCLWDFDSTKDMLCFSAVFFFHIFSQSLRYWGIEEWVDSFEPNHSHMLNGAGRFTNICPKITHFVGKYTIHGAYGTWRRNEEMWRVPLLSTSISGRPARRSGAAASKSSKSSESSESSAAGGTGPGTERGRRGRGRSRKNWRWSPLEMMSLTQKCGLKHSTDVWIWENVEVEQ